MTRRVLPNSEGWRSGARVVSRALFVALAVACSADPGKRPESSDAPATAAPWVPVSVTVQVDVTLCRCGHSDNKPFCSGKHWGVNFQAGSGPTERG